ncbi:hypothetical protein NEIPOLOT_01547 [Neisseria polysaccharea ATCC 43768]|nr:hypothetical protein NEIPOLOT_01547 [Neisseria polysaccharea ATCC 43768]
MTVQLLRVGFGGIGGLKPTLRPALRIRPTMRLANLSLACPYMFQMS